MSHTVNEHGRRLQVVLTAVLLVVSSTVAAVPVAADGHGELTIDVEHENGNQAQEVNALIIYQDGEHYRTVSNYPGIDLEHTFDNLPTGHDYRVNAYIHDQFAGSVSTTIGPGGFLNEPNAKSKTIAVENPVELQPQVYYSDGATPLEGAVVQVKSHEDDPSGSGKVVWRSATTTSDGRTNPSGLFLYPTESNDPGYYTVEVVVGDDTVASKRVDSLTRDTTTNLVTSESVPTYDLSASSTDGGDVDESPRGAVERGETVSVIAEPDDGYEFDHWSGDYPDGSRTDERIDVRMDGDKQVTAHFDKLEGDLTVDVRHQNGDRAQEVNALVVWQDEVGGEPFRKFSNYPSVAIRQRINDLPGGHEYRVNAYVNDQYAGTTGWVDIEDSDVSRTITVDDPVAIEPRVYYSDGETPLEGATVQIVSHEGVEWRSGQTVADGTTEPSPLFVHPTDEGYYDVEVYYEGTQVASERLDSLDSDETVEITTDASGTVDGEVVGYQSPAAGDEYELDRRYDVRLRVKNTGSVSETFTVRAPERTGRRSATTEKTVRIAPGETETVTFEQWWYGTYTDERAFQHELAADTDDDGRTETVDESSVTLVGPPDGEILLRPNTTDGESTMVRVQVTDTETGKTQVDTRVRVTGTDVEAKRYTVPTGTYEVSVSADGYRSRSETVTVEEDTRRSFKPVLTPTGVDARVVDRSLSVDAGPYRQGETVTATVTVENTGEQEWGFFVGYSVRHAESGTQYSNEGQTGKFVTLAPGERRDVTVEWRVDDSARTGAYDAITAVWYGYPDDGADRIESSEWETDAFEVNSRSKRETVTYDGATYTVETFGDGTVGVYDSAGTLVSTETARAVLRYKTFRDFSVDNPDRDWSETIDEMDDLEKYYWFAHLTQGAITAYKAYVNAQFGGYKNSVGEFIDISLQATRLMEEQRGTSTTAGWLHQQTEQTQTLYQWYDRKQRVDDAVKFTETAYRIKQKSDDVDTMVDAIKTAERSSDASGTIAGELVGVAMTPLDDVSASLETVQKQSLVGYHWAKNSKVSLQMMRELEEKRQQGTITRREMKLYYLVQIHYYNTFIDLWQQMAKLERAGSENSVAYEVISDVQGTDATEFEQLAETYQQIVGYKTEAMAKYLNRSDNTVNRSVNVRDDPVETTLDQPEPLSVTLSSWVEPGEPVTVQVRSRGEPVINAEVRVGDTVLETGRDGNATTTLYDTGGYTVTAQKDGFDGVTTGVTVREPQPATVRFDTVTVGELDADTEVTRQTSFTNDGETTLAVESVDAPADGVTATLLDGRAAPGETITVEVTVDTGEMDAGAFGTTAVLEWTDLSGTTPITVTGTVAEAAEPDPTVTASFVTDTPDSVAEEPVEFDASDSRVSAGSIDEYRWDFDGDGETDQTTQTPTVAHSFPSSGEYPVTLTVVAGDQSTTTTRTVAVDAAPSVSVDAQRRVGDAPSPGGTVEVTVTVQVDEEVDELRLDPEFGPLTVVEQSTTPAATFDSEQSQWLWSMPVQGTLNVTYVLQVPTDATDGRVYTLDGRVSGAEIETVQVQGESTVEVSQCVGGAIAGTDGQIGLREVQRLVDAWQQSETVAGESVGLRQLQRLVDAWQQGESVSCGVSG
jgi:archaellum component FlaF (FlaF/FlaG flagellin family)